MLGAVPTHNRLLAYVCACACLAFAGHILATDGGQAFKKFGKCLRNVPHLIVVHRKNKFAEVHRIPIKGLPPKLQKSIQLFPQRSSRVVRVKSGDQCAENTFSIIKRNLARLNLSRSTTRASLNFLAAAWVQKNCGVVGMLKALRIYKEWARKNLHPEKAYKDSTWLTALEHIV